VGRRYARWARLCAAVVGAILFIQFLSPTRFQLEAFEVQVAAAVCSRGRTEIAVPPVGTVGARTHLAPLRLTVRLEGVDIEALRSLARQAPVAAEMGERLVSGLRRVAGAFAARVLGVACLGGVAGALLAGDRHPAGIAAGGAAGGVVAAALMATTYATFEPAAFLTPDYRGALKAAPWLPAMVQDSLARVPAFTGQMERLAANLYTLFGRMDRLRDLAAPQSDVTVLVVSDIHNNPAAPGLMRRVIETFGVDLVIDAGDLTDFGTPLETALSGNLGGLGVPYLIAPGNHDAAAVLQAAAAGAGVTVLDGRVVERAGVAVLGIADPRERSGESSGDPGDAAPLRGDALRAAQGQARDALAAAEEPPLIFVAHDPRVAEAARDAAPVVIAGHSHELEVSQRGQTIFINPGSTGAAGLRGLQSGAEVPYSMVILYLARDAGGTAGGQEGAGGDGAGALRPVAADSVRVYSLGASLTLERTVFEPGAGEGKGKGPSKP